MTSVKAELVDLRDVHPFMKWAGGKKQLLPQLDVVLPYIGDNIAYQHGLHFCQEVYSYRNQNKV